MGETCAMCGLELASIETRNLYHSGEALKASDYRGKCLRDITCWQRGYDREKARADAANSKLAATDVERLQALSALAAANARADAAEALAEDRRKARATVAAMYEAVREAELRPPLATYLEMRREGPNAPLQYYAMKPEKVTGFYGALRERWNGTDVERWTKEFVEARDRVSASESALAAARRECAEQARLNAELHRGACSGYAALLSQMDRIGNAIIGAKAGHHDGAEVVTAALNLAAPAPGRDPATEDADAAWRDGEAHGRDK